MIHLYFFRAKKMTDMLVELTRIYRFHEIFFNFNLDFWEINYLEHKKYYV